jgi:AP-4 complex subunit mu-1
MVEIFFKLVRSWKDSKGTYPPPFIDGGEGLHFLYIRRNGLYFVGATKFNVPPAFGLELLSRIAGVCKDYCGLLNEESIRLNFVLVYELLDEVLDFGYPQGTSTEVLKSYISNQPCNVTFDKPLLRQPGKTLPSHAANKPIATSVESMRTQKNEIFVDLLERLTILVAPTGNVLRSHLDGCIQMRSFLGGQPEIRLGLNEDLVIGREERRHGYGTVVLDDCNFHESANLEQFEKERSLSIMAPDGEFTLMNYRISGEFLNSIPFRVTTAVEDGDIPKSLRLCVRLKCEIPSKAHATNVILRIPVPKATVSSSHEPLGPGQTSELRIPDKCFQWKCKKIHGGEEQILLLRLNLSDVSRTAKKEVNAVSMDFEIPMYICSGLNIRFLRVFEHGGSGRNPHRWVRYITHSDSFVFRV